MKVKEIMTAEHSLECCSPETKLHIAAKTMKSANCGALPIVDKAKKVVGMVTDRDICLSLAEHQTPAKTKVEEIMTEKVHTVGPEEDITVALRQMRVHQVGRVPVVDGKGKLKGVVSLHQLIQNTIKEGKMLGSISDSGENILKTMMSIGERYNGTAKSKKASYSETEELEEVL